MSILDLIADIPTNANLRREVQRLENEVAELKKENARLKERVSELEAQLAKNRLANEFEEHHGALFKRHPGGGYHAAVYCPNCKKSAGANHTLPYECSCGWYAAFNKFNLRDIMKDLPS